MAFYFKIKKEVMKILIIITATLALCSCNKESLIEGITNEKNIVNVNVTKYFDNSGNAKFTIKTGNDSIILNFTLYRYLLGSFVPSYTPYNSLDSNIQIKLTTNVFMAHNKNNLGYYYLEGYNYNEVISPNYFGSLSMSLIYGYRKFPYASNTWLSSNTNGNATTKWNFKEMKYLGFKTFSVTSLPNLGWIEITFTNNSVTIGKIGYQSLKQIKAGD